MKLKLIELREFIRRQIRILKDTEYYFDFKPSIKVWTSDVKPNHLNRNAIYFTGQETYYDGDYFITGVFIYILYGDSKAFHMKIEWWNMDVFKPIRKNAN